MTKADRIFDEKARPDLVFGLVGPLGAELSFLADALARGLAELQYEPHLVKLSDLIAGELGLVREEADKREDHRLRRRMIAGTELRHQWQRGDAAALLAIEKITALRAEASEDHGSGQAFILRSLKHRREIDTLRRVYGDAFIVISAYSPRIKRLKRLTAEIAETHETIEGLDRFSRMAHELIARDEAEQGTDLGQDVGGAFPQADLFINAEAPDEGRGALKRFLQLLFGHPFHTPTRDEAGMFQARAAALRSADLSRQVGAALTTREGDLVASGCNEVPKAGGGQYWTDDDPLFDGRDFRLGTSSSSRYKREILVDTLARLKDAGWLDNRMASKETRDLAERLLDGPDKDIMDDSQITSLLEFGRIVHAEMAALSDAARRGLPVQDSTLYVTTFPCHMCARHIIAAGLQRVVYIEPYPKSRAQELYADSILVDRDRLDPDYVNFQAFVGVAPRRYMALFAMPKRKGIDGAALSWSREEALPRLEDRHDAAGAREAAVAAWLQQQRQQEL